MTAITIYHNPRCTKSRQTLALLRQHGAEPEIVLYMEQPLNKKTLRSVLTKLGMSAREILRTAEAAYKERGLAAPGLSETQLIDAMLEEPRLIQRPIVVKGNRAVLGRPPENALELL